MIQLIGSVALLVAVVGGCIAWAWRAGLRERFNQEAAMDTAPFDEWGDRCRRLLHVGPGLHDRDLHPDRSGLLLFVASLVGFIMLERKKLDAQAAKLRAGHRPAAGHDGGELAMAERQIDFPDAQKPPRHLQTILIAVAVVCIVIVEIVNNV